MRIIIDMATDNAAFEDDSASGSHTEIARIVCEVGRRFDTDGPYAGPLYDVNGNQVGQVRVEEEE